MAYKAEIAVNVKGLKAVRTLESSLNKISGKISAINKISIGNSKAAKIEEKVAKSKEAQRVSMIQTRRVGDAVQRAADKGLQTEKALAAVKRAAKADAQGALKVSIEQRKIALEELKTQEQIAKVVKDKTLTGFGPKSPVFGRSTQMDSAGNTAAILQDPTTKVSPVQQALAKMEERSARNTKQAVINRKKSLSLGKDIVRIKKQEATQNARNLRSEQKQTSQAAERLKVQTANRLNASITPKGDFTRLSDRQSRNVEGKRTFMNNPFGRMGIRPTRGFDAQSALISGGFPLLFGQGPGVAAAGALGGGIGGMFGQMGGFAGGIAATAAVQSIQNAINGIGELGMAMNRLNPNISALSQAMGIAGTMEQKRLQLIEQNQGKQAAFNAALEMLGEKIGADKAAELQKFGETFRDLTNSVTLFFTKVQAAVAKLLNQATDKVQETFIKPNEARKFVRENPNNPAFADINAQIAALEGTGSGKGRSGAKQVSDQINALKAQRLEIAKSLLQKKEEEEVQKNINQLVTAGLGDLREKNDLHLATINGTREEFEIQKAIKDKVEEMGLTMAEVEGKERQRIENAIRTNRQLEEQAENAEKIREAFNNLSVTIKDDIKNGIAGLIRGTSTLGDMLNNIADRLLSVGLDHILFGSVLGSSGPKGGLLGLLGFANGGRPPVGKPSIVGEKGPELFVPKTSGTIVPNHKLGGGGTTNISVNVDASGSSVQGDEQQSKELGRVISVAIQSEILKQRRPGGLLR